MSPAISVTLKLNKKSGIIVEIKDSISHQDVTVTLKLNQKVTLTTTGGQQIICITHMERDRDAEANVSKSD